MLIQNFFDLIACDISQINITSSDHNTNDLSISIISHEEICHRSWKIQFIRPRSDDGAMYYIVNAPRERLVDKTLRGGGDRRRANFFLIKKSLQPLSLNSLPSLLQMVKTMDRIVQVPICIYSRICMQFCLFDDSYIRIITSK